MEVWWGQADQTLRQGYAFAALAVSVPVMVTAFGGGEGLEVLAVAELLVLALLAWCVWRMVSEGTLLIRRTGFELPLLLLLVTAVVSTLLSGNRYNSTLGTFELGTYVAVFFVAANRLASLGRLRLIAIALVLLGIGESLLAFYQRFVGGIERVTGSMTYSTYLTDLLLVAVSMSLAYLLFGRRSVPRLLAAGIASAVIFAALVMTGTRAAIISLLVVGSLLGVLRGRAWLLLCLLILAVLFIVVPNPVTDRLLNVGLYDIYAYKRLDIWQQSLQVLATAPLFGVGPRNFAAVARRFSFPVDAAVGRYAHSAQIAHNEFLQVGAELGVIGLVLFSWIIVLFIGLLRELRGVAVKPSPLPTAPVAGAAAAVTALIVHALFDNVLYLPANAVIFFLLLGSLAGLRSGGRLWRMELRPSRLRVFYVVVLVVVLAQGIVRPAVAHFQSRRAGAAVRAGSYREAITTLERARAIAPGDAVLAGALGDLYDYSFGETGSIADLWSSFVMYEHAIAADRLGGTYETALADMLERRVGFGDPGNAETILSHRQRAVDLDPHNPFIHADLAAVHHGMGEWERAIAQLQRALALEPNFADAHATMGRLYEERGEDSLALEHYRSALDIPIDELMPHARTRYEIRLLTFDRKAVARSVDQLTAEVEKERGGPFDD